MARSADPDSAGSQFFIVHKNSNFLDGEYTVFGQLITQESYDTLDALVALPTTTLGPPDGAGGVSDVPMNYGNAEITSAEIQKRSEIEDKLQLGMPERMTSAVKQIPDLRSYTNAEFAFSLDVPKGFIATEPERMNESTPVFLCALPMILAPGRSLSRLVAYSRRSLSCFAIALKSMRDK